MKIMDTNITFRFVTRTRDEDYRIFSSGGNKTHSDSEFEPLSRKGRIIPEEGPCAVMWEESSLIFLTVSSMQRDAKDRANRPIRFSFCEIFTDRVKAWTAFTRIISDFSGAENVVRSLIHEPTTGEDIDFMQEKFISWLQEKSCGQVTFQTCREGDVITRDGDTWLAVWPPEGLLLRWCKTEDDEISCERVNVS